MADDLAERVPVPCKPDIDDNGVDRAQIRQMLDLTPAERLLLVAEFVGSLRPVRRADEDRQPG